MSKPFLSDPAFTKALLEHVERDIRENSLAAKLCRRQDNDGDKVFNIPRDRTQPVWVNEAYSVQARFMAEGDVEVYPRGGVGHGLDSKTSGSLMHAIREGADVIVGYPNPRIGAWWRPTGIVEK